MHTHVDLWSQRALVLSQLGAVNCHRHAVAALLVGLNGDFRIHDGTWWRRTRSAFVPAGCRHRVDAGTTLMATMYLFPLGQQLPMLINRLQLAPAHINVDFALPEDFVDGLRRVHSGALGRLATGQWLDQLTGHEPNVMPLVDSRVGQAANALQGDLMLRNTDLARGAGLSLSRLMHLFSAQLGVSLGQYRLWARMLQLTTSYAAGESLTMAGLDAGFADSSHLSHAFKTMFGIAPSRVLNRDATLRTEP